MTAIIKTKYKVRSARDFLENFDRHPIIPPFTEAQHEIDRNHYVFIGRARPWPTDLLADPPISDIAPPLPLDTVNGDYRAWDAMLGLKKVTSAQVSLVIPRHNWDTSGETVYAQYDADDPNLFLHPTPQDIIDASGGGYVAGPIYVMTDEFHVFKCLDNNNGSKSVDKPTLPVGSPWEVNTPDGYKWKFMYTVSPSLIESFLTDKWIPVRNVGAPTVADDGSTQWDVENDAVSGAIDAIHITEAGTGYDYVQEGQQLLGATANTASLSASASGDSGAYVGATIYTTGGLGYPQAPRKIVSYNEITKVATLDSVWTADSSTTYEIWPTVNISGDGSGAEAKALVHTSGPDQGKLKQIVITDPGSDYHFASATIEGGKIPAGVQATVKPILSPLGGHGSDAENELGAFFVMINTKLQFDEGEGDFPINNDYRQVGLIRDLKDETGTLATQDTRIAMKRLNLTSITTGIGGDFQPDETIIGNDGVNPDATAKIGELILDENDPTLGTMTFFQDELTGYEDFVSGMTITGQTTGATAVISSITPSEVTKNSGEILYIEHRRPILRAPDQIEEIKMIIEF